ncbi:hypothetical protein P7D31_12885 [Enterococcus dongliensis]|uniref:helix-turn-helix domain-containing protein n=1 Tax=Enterococcus dongliensis TaxID=2559925 RepID=UPI00288EA0BC|nr:hypothetical protein [Enterococcus dongliensis]MDT2640997.1 hypothetical protein [Enterococcus dongliensis]
MKEKKQKLYDEIIDEIVDFKITDALVYGTLIRSIRKKYGLSQEEFLKKYFPEATEIVASTEHSKMRQISRWENGESAPRNDILEVLREEKNFPHFDEAYEKLKLKMKNHYRKKVIADEVIVEAHINNKELEYELKTIREDLTNGINDENAIGFDLSILRIIFNTDIRLLDSTGWI